MNVWIALVMEVFGLSMTTVQKVVNPINKNLMLDICLEHKLQ